LAEEAERFRRGGSIIRSGPVPHGFAPHWVRCKIQRENVKHQNGKAAFASQQKRVRNEAGARQALASDRLTPEILVY